MFCSLRFSPHPSLSLSLWWPCAIVRTPKSSYYFSLALSARIALRNPHATVLVLQRCDFLAVAGAVQVQCCAAKMWPLPGDLDPGPPLPLPTIHHGLDLAQCQERCWRLNTLGGTNHQQNRCVGEHARVLIKRCLNRRLQTFDYFSIYSEIVLNVFYYLKSWCRYYSEFSSAVAFTRSVYYGQSNFLTGQSCDVNIAVQLSDVIGRHLFVSSEATEAALIFFFF